MKLKIVHVALACLIFCLFIGNKGNAQVPTRCFEIQSVLADACGSPEGENEMVRLQVGPSPLTVSHLKVIWPNNTFKGFCTDAVKLDSLNKTIVGCGYLLTPPGGIVPAGKQLLIVTSTDMNVAFNSFANLSDTIYLIFQCAGNTAGHFVNYNSATGVRTLIITDTTSLCGDTVSYDRMLLTNVNGGHGGSASLNDGASISYTYSNVPTYYNIGCNASFIPASVNAGNDTTYTFCTSPPVISLHGVKVGGIRSTKWIGGLGTFSQPDSLNTTYTPSPADISPIKLYLTGKLCPDTLYDTISITIAPPVSSVQSQLICQGSTYHIGTHNYTASGTFKDTLLTAGGCDSVVTTTLTVISVTSQPVTLNACGSVVYKGTTYTASTTFQDTLRGSTGCDSIRYGVSITVRYPSTYTQNLMLCPGQALAAGTHTYATAGTYKDTVPNAAGCDSIINTTLGYAGNTLDAGNNAVICSGDSAQLQATGGLTYSWTPASGLSSTSVANPEAKPTTTTTYKVTSSVASANQIVNGDFSSGNTGFSSSYAYTTTNIVEGEYTVTNNPRSWNGGMAACTDHTTGTSGMLVVNGATVPNVTIYCQTVNTAPNTTYAFSTWLESVSVGNPAQLQFSINSALIGPVFVAPATTCTWQQFYTTWNSGTATSAQICIVNQNTNASGNDFALDDISFSPLCTNTDSVTVTVIQPTTSTINQSICQGSTYTYNSHTYSATGTYLDTINAVSGCDSIVTTHLTVLIPASQTVSLSDCRQVVYKGTTYSVTTSFQDTLKGATGCDSIHYTVNIRINTVTNQTVNVPAACGRLSYGGNTYTVSTAFNDTLKYRSGCDSIITAVTITVDQPASFTQNPLICLGQTFTAGANTYNTSGTYTDIIGGGAVSGCDSTITTNLTVLTPVNQTLNPSGCGQVIYKGTTYTATQTIQDTLKGTTGCDSILYTVNITVNTVSNQTVNVPAACGQVTYNGKVYTSSAAFNDTLRYVSGCDSIINAVTITINPFGHFAQSATICLGQAFSAGGHTYTSSGTYIDTVAGGSASGCDSTINTTLTVISPTTGLLSLSGTCTLMYNGRNYTASTSFLDTAKSMVTGCDSLYRTVTITVTPVVAATSTKNVCINPGQSYFAGGQNQTMAGAYRDTIRTPGGCDSLYVTTTLKVITPVSVSRRIDSCYQANLGGVTLTSDTVFRYTVLSSAGCDSIYRVDSLVIHSPSFSVTTSQVLPLVQGDSTQLIIIPQGTYHNVVWSPDSNIDNIHAVSPQVAPNHTTTYTVRAADSNNCRVSLSIEIPVTTSTLADFIMPTAFSPNGDAVNDLFKVILRTGAEVTMFHIYNRWGELIYDRDRDNKDGWDGTFKNIQQPTGVFIYFVGVKGVSGKTTTQQGNVTLLR